VFLDSLRFKFSGHQTPKYIFKILRDRSDVGLFYPAGPWIISLGEGIIPLSQLAGAAIAIGIMTGAILFHLFTPLGTKTPTKWEGDKPVKWSAALFYSAIGCWVCAAFLIALRWSQIA